MPLPLIVPTDDETVRKQRTATAWRLAGATMLLTALSIIMNRAGVYADSIVLTRLGPPAALIFILASGFTKLRRTMQDTTLAAAGLVLGYITMIQSGRAENGIWLMAGIVTTISFLAWALHRNLDERAGTPSFVSSQSVSLFAICWLLA